MSNCACGVHHDALLAAKKRLLFIEITPLCNNRCSGCGNVFADNRSPKPLDAAQWIVVLNRIAPSAGHLEITGGEPTLHPEFETILRHVDALGVPFTLFSNGRWRRPARLVAFLRELVHLDGLLISVHGARAESHEAFAGVAGSLAETLANIRLAADHGLKVRTSTVLTRYSCAEIDEILVLAEAIGAVGSSFQRFIGAPVPALQPDRETLRAVVARINAAAIAARDTVAGSIFNRGDCACAGDKDTGPIRFGTPIPGCFEPNGSKPCLAGIAQATVDPWGNVRPCNHSTWHCGSLLSESLDDVMASDTMARFRDLVPAACLDCASFADCRGGCRAMIAELRLTHDPLMRLGEEHIYGITTGRSDPVGGAALAARRTAQCGAETGDQ